MSNFQRRPRWFRDSVYFIAIACVIPALVACGETYFTSCFLGSSDFLNGPSSSALTQSADLVINTIEAITSVQGAAEECWKFPESKAYEPGSYDQFTDHAPEDIYTDGMAVLQSSKEFQRWLELNDDAKAKTFTDQEITSLLLHEYWRHGDYDLPKTAASRLADAKQFAKARKSIFQLHPLLKTVGDDAVTFCKHVATLHPSLVYESKDPDVVKLMELKSRLLADFKSLYEKLRTLPDLDKATMSCGKVGRVILKGQQGDVAQSQIEDDASPKTGGTKPPQGTANPDLKKPAPKKHVK